MFDLINGITTIQFFADLITDHRPNLCSLPIAAIKYFPSKENFKSLINPVIGILNKGVADRKCSSNAHNLIKPSSEPKSN